MNSPSSSSASGADQELEEDLDGFDDFTIASSWEKVIATVEATAREWQSAGSAGLLRAGAVSVVGSRNLYRIHKEISFGVKSYVVIFFFHVGGDNEHRDEWPIGLHPLQLWFGVKDFVVIAPVSHSGVVLDAPEATTLLSTTAIALSSCGSDWPAFVPVHDPTRKAYKGIQGTKSSYSITFEADRIGSWVPVRLMHLEGLYELFVSKVAFTASSSATVPALKVEFTMRLTYRTAMFGYGYNSRVAAPPIAEAKTDNDGPLSDEPAWDDDLPWAEWHSVEDPINGFELVAIWNNTTVDNKYEMAEYENASTFSADKWSLIPCFAEKKAEDQHEEGFAGRLEALVKAFHIAGEAQFMDDFASVVKPEMDLLLEAFTAPPPSVLEKVLKDLFYEAVIPSGDGFSYRANGSSIKGAPRDSLFGRFTLQALRFGTCNIRAISELWLEFVREVRWCWDECQPLPRVPVDEPPDLSTCLIHQKLQMLAHCIVLKAEEPAPVVKETVAVHEEGDRTDAQNSETTPTDYHSVGQNIADRKALVSEVAETCLIGSSPPNSGPVPAISEALPSFTTVSSQDEMESLFAPPSQESNAASQPRESKAAATSASSLQETATASPSLESVFVASPPGDSMAASSSCERKAASSRQESLAAPHLDGRNENSQAKASTSRENTTVPESFQSSDDDELWEPLETVDFSEGISREERRGSAGPVKHLMLLKVQMALHAPVLQRSPVMTEDMLLEREQAIAALSRSPSEKVARIRLETDILASDMSAFKAANPGAVLEDFVRWHSPRDWLVDDFSKDGEISGSRNHEGCEAKWPPQGRLSNRMAHSGNVWHQIWEQTSPRPASEQKPLFDYQREGEKVMHYLDTLRPQQLLAQMLCTAFVVSADALRRARTGPLPRLHSELAELYASMDVILEPLSNFLTVDVPSKEVVDAWHKDLLQLCAVLGKVEKDVFVAASLFQKLKSAPTVMTTLFNSFLDDGVKLTCARVSTRSQGSWEGASKQLNDERELVADLFPLSSTSQSVGKSQRMGNFLNGNEPDVREVKFHCYEEDLHKRFGSRKEKKRSKMYSHRMYICGTSNDLQVALSVVSRD